MENLLKKDIKVLVIEDIEEDFHLIKKTLQKAGLAHAKQVNTEPEFVEALESFCPDVILSDQSLPQLNSHSVLEITQEKQIHVPFIVVSDNGTEEYAAMCINKGAHAYISKSNLDQLPNAIQDVLKEDAQGSGLAKAHQVIDKLSKQNKELESFIYHASHNLRAPLMSMLGLIDLIKHNQPDGNGSSFYVELLEKNVHKLDETLKELVEYVKSSKDELAIESVNVVKIIEDQFERMKYMPGSEKIHKEICIEGQDIPFYSESYRLSVIANNLISNAIKYYDSNKEKPFIKVFISITATHALLEFKDNGIGIDSSYATKVFDMFFRASGKSEGAGLGLYIVKEAIEKLMGQINLQSEPGKGTVFTLVLPNKLNQ